MDIVFLPEAERKLQEIPVDIEGSIRSSIEDLSSKPTSNKSVCLVEIQGEMLFRLKLTGEDLNHRVIFDISDGKVIVVTVIHRDEGYQSL